MNGSELDNGERGRRTQFFALLVAATVLPYLLLPAHATWLRGSIGMDQVTALVLFLGANGHVGSSFFFYDEPAMRGFMVDSGRMRFFVLPVGLIAAGIALFTLGNTAVRAHAVTAFWVWQIHHFTRQNHGILAFISRDPGLSPALSERSAVALTNAAGIFGALGFVTPYRETFLADWGWQLHAIGLGAYAAAWVSYAVSLRDPARRRPSWRSLLLLLLMLFYLPLYAFEDAFTAVFLFLTAHGLQYLVFMRYVVRGSEFRPMRAFASVAALAFAIGYTIKVFQGGGFAGPLDSALLGAAYGIVIWHFLLDARVWRLSEPFQRAYMTRRFDFLLAPRAGSGTPPAT